MFKTITIIFFLLIFFILSIRPVPIRDFFFARRFTNHYSHKVLPMVTGRKNVMPPASQKNTQVGKKQRSPRVGFETAIVS
jgi:hypothetical protein